MVAPQGTPLIARQTSRWNGVPTGASGTSNAMSSPAK